MTGSASVSTAGSDGRASAGAGTHGSGSGTRVTIDRLVCRVRAPAHGDGRRAGDRLARLARAELPGRCAALLDELPADGAVYRVRRIDLHLPVDARAAAHGDVARRWAALLVGRLVDTMKAGDPADVVRWASPQTYLAGFLRDLLDGCAWQRWWYDELAPLKRLDPGQAALHLLCARPQGAGDVLAELAATGHDTALVGRWGAADVDRLWAALGFADTPTAVGATVLSAVRDALAETPEPSAPGTDALARHRLTAWVTLLRRDPGRAGQAPVAALLARLVDLRGLCRRDPGLAPMLAMPSGPSREVVRRLAAGPLADRLAWLGPLAERRPADLARMVEAASSAVSPLWSPHGGVALCIPAMVELGLWQRWRADVEEPTARRYVFAILLQALGRRRAVFALGDDLLAALAGLDRPPPADARVPPEPDAGPPPWAAARPPGTPDGAFRLGPIGLPWLTPSLDAALATAVAAVMQATERRLPRSRRSRGLLATCLAQPATWRAGPDRVSVTVHGTVAEALLRTADLPEGLEVPWLDRPFHLSVSSRGPRGS